MVSLKTRANRFCVSVFRKTANGEETQWVHTITLLVPSSHRRIASFRHILLGAGSWVKGHPSPYRALYKRWRRKESGNKEEITVMVSSSWLSKTEFHYVRSSSSRGSYRLCDSPSLSFIQNSWNFIEGNINMIPILGIFSWKSLTLWCRHDS